jgi:hypothetical protein
VSIGQFSSWSLVLISVISKTGFRELTDGTFPKAKQLVPECLDHVSVSNVRKYFCHCYRYMDAYK